MLKTKYVLKQNTSCSQKVWELNGNSAQRPWFTAYRLPPDRIHSPPLTPPTYTPPPPPSPVTPSKRTPPPKSPSPPPPKVHGAAPLRTGGRGCRRYSLKCCIRIPINDCMRVEWKFWAFNGHVRSFNHTRHVMVYEILPALFISAI